MKKKISTILFTMVFIAGLSLLLYPLVSDAWNDYRQQQLITSYEQVIDEQVLEGKIDYTEEWAKARKYNEDLLPAILPDAFALRANSEEIDEVYMSCLNIAGDEIMGIVEIPKIKVRLPIYHTSTEEVLLTAAGHLEGSSLPVGGESTHAVVTAHRGLPSAALFTDLDQLKEGDHFLFRVLDETLCYEVDLITVTEPSDTTALQIEDGKDYASLFTCTPYGVNSHRLMVRGHRVPYVEEVIQEEAVPTGPVSLHTSYALWVGVGFGITGLFIMILILREKKIRKKMLEASQANIQEQPKE